MALGIWKRGTAGRSNFGHSPKFLLPGLLIVALAGFLYNTFGPPSVGRYLAPSVAKAATLSFSQQQEIASDGLYRQNGKLYPVDTTLYENAKGFSMDKSRYHLFLPASLGAGGSIQAAYQNISLGIIPLDSRNVQGQLISNEQQIDGADNPSLKGKGVVYPDAYGTDTGLGIIADPVDIRKIVAIGGKGALGNFPVSQDKSAYDVSFQLLVPKGAVFSAEFGSDANPTVWDGKSTVSATNNLITITAGDAKEYIQPASIWDSQGKKIPITLTLSRDAAGNVVLTKHLPIYWLDSASFPVYTDSTISFGTTATFDVGPATILSSASLDATHAVIAYYANSHEYAVVGVVSGNTITYGTIVTIDSLSTDAISIASLDSTHVVVAYDTGGAAAGYASIGTVSGSSISFGTPTQFDAAVGITISIAALDSTHVVIGYDSDGSGLAEVGTVSGSSISFGTQTLIPNGGTASHISAAALGASSAVIAFYDGTGSEETAVVGTISGSSISFGAATAFDSLVASSISATPLDSTHVVIGYDDGGDGLAVVGTVSGSSISFGTAAIFNSGSTAAISVVATSSAQAVVGFISNGNGFAAVGDVSGSAISFGQAGEFDTGLVDTPSVTLLDSTHVVVGYTNDGYGDAVIGTLSGGGGGGGGGSIHHAAKYPYLVQNHFQWYMDDSGLNSATALAGQDADYQTAANQTVRLRIETANTGEGAGGFTSRLEYQEDSSSWNEITAVSDLVQLISSPHFADGDATNSRLTATGSFAPGAGKYDSSDAASLVLGSAAYTEDEYVISLRPSAAGHVFQFRITNAGTVLDDYAAMPTLTVISSLPPVPSNFNPANHAVIKTAAPVISFSLDKPGECRMAASPKSYDDMAHDTQCQSWGTDISCPMQSMSLGADQKMEIYIACKDQWGNENSADSAYPLTYSYSNSPSSGVISGQGMISGPATLGVRAPIPQ